MGKGRLEAFSDGVFAIIITIMVLELRPPSEGTLEALRPLVPSFLAYVFSFIMLGIYWNNHHHLLQATQQVDGRVLWANLHLLLWLSLFPFVTAWVGDTNFGGIPIAVYGIVCLGAGIGYYFLTTALLALHSKDSKLAAAIGSDFKGKVSLVIYIVGIALATVVPLLGVAVYVVVLAIWVIPDRRIERTLTK